MYTRGRCACERNGLFCLAAGSGSSFLDKADRGPQKSGRQPKPPLGMRLPFDQD